jgi:hypothetical protein
MKLARVIDRNGGNGFGVLVVREARLAGIPISLAAALVEQESNFRNVFGHDPMKCHAHVQGQPVTRRRYKHYRKHRPACGMQGVGLTQLTWFEFQDLADKLGGAWKPSNQLAVAFDLVKSLTANHGLSDGLRRYNGSGPAAVEYSKEVRAKARRWHERFKEAGL